MRLAFSSHPRLAVKRTIQDKYGCHICVLGVSGEDDLKVTTRGDHIITQIQQQECYLVYNYVGTVRFDNDMEGDDIAKWEIDEQGYVKHKHIKTYISIATIDRFSADDLGWSGE